MPKQNDDAPAEARAEALQSEIERLEQENAALRAKQAKAHGKSRKKSGAKAMKEAAEAAEEANEAFVAQAKALGAQASRWTFKGQLAYHLWTIGFAVVFLAVPAALLISSGRVFPKAFAPGFTSMTAICLGAIAVPSSLFRVLFSSVPIMAKDENNQPYEVHRTMQRRWVFLLLSVLAFGAGVAVLFATATPASSYGASAIR